MSPSLLRKPDTPADPVSTPSSPTLSDSALLDALADDHHFDLSSHREKRLEELKEQVEKIKLVQSSEFGRVLTYGEEKKLIERMAWAF